jgi:hypothetical protein
MYYISNPWDYVIETNHRNDMDFEPHLTLLTQHSEHRTDNRMLIRKRHSAADIHFLPKLEFRSHR